MSDEKKELESIILPVYVTEETIEERMRPATPLEERMKEWQRVDENGNYIKLWEEMEPVSVETERFNEYPEFARDIESKSTAARLFGLASKFAAQLAEARQEHVVKIDTIATEALATSKQLIDALQQQIMRQDQIIRYFRRWLLSREVMDLILRNKTLEAEKAELARQIVEMRAAKSS